MRIVLLSLAAALAAHAQWVAPNPVTKVERQPDAVLFTLKEGVLRVQVCNDSILRITQSPTSTIPNTPQYVVNRTSWPAAKWDVQQNDKAVTISTARMRVTINRADATLAFADSSGRGLVQEGPNTLTPATVNG